MTSTDELVSALKESLSLSTALAERVETLKRQNDFLLGAVLRAVASPEAAQATLLEAVNHLTLPYIGPVPK